MKHHTTLGQGMKYNYGSIMHSGENESARDPSVDSMLPKKEGTVIGQRGSMSDGDVRSVNKLYCRD